MIFDHVIASLRSTAILLTILTIIAIFHVLLVELSIRWRPPFGTQSPIPKSADQTKLKKLVKRIFAPSVIWFSTGAIGTICAGVIVRPMLKITWDSAHPRGYLIIAIFVIYALTPPILSIWAYAHVDRLRFNLRHATIDKDLGVNLYEQGASLVVSSARAGMVAILMTLIPLTFSLISFANMPDIADRRRAALMAVMLLATATLILFAVFTLASLAYRTAPRERLAATSMRAINHPRHADTPTRPSVRDFVQGFVSSFVTSRGIPGANVPPRLRRRRHANQEAIDLAVALERTPIVDRTMEKNDRHQVAQVKHAMCNAIRQAAWRKNERKIREHSAMAAAMLVTNPIIITQRIEMITRDLEYADRRYTSRLKRIENFIIRAGASAGAVASCAGIGLALYKVVDALVQGNLDAIFSI